jgi:hypothetical protein
MIMRYIIYRPMEREKGRERERRREGEREREREREREVSSIFDTRASVR